MRIGEEDWKLLDLETNELRIIQPKENSERFEFGTFFQITNLLIPGVKPFSMGLNVVRDIQILGMTDVAPVELVDTTEGPKKRKRDNGEPDGETSKKHKEKKHQEEKHDKHDKHKDKHHKEKEKKRDKKREEERKEKHKHKNRHDKGEKHRH